MEKKLNIQNTIMGQSCHHFVYGAKGDARNQFLKDMVGKFPVVLDNSHPIAIYVDSIGLPQVSNDNQLDKVMLSRICSEYLDFSIAASTIDSTMAAVDGDVLQSRAISFLNVINRLFLYDKGIQIKKMKELSSILHAAKDTYSRVYEKYVTTLETGNFLDGMPMPFMRLEKFMEGYKEMVGTESAIRLIADHQEPIALLSERAINRIIASRVNSIISMKVVCEPDGWSTYVDFNGVFIERIHDYGVVEFDGSYQKCLERAKQGR